MQMRPVNPFPKQWRLIVAASIVAAAIIIITMLATGTTAWAQSNPQKAPVTGLSATSGSNPGEIDVSWDAHPAGAKDYRVAWAPDGESFRGASDTNWNAKPTATGMTITGLTGGSDYKVKVRARFDSNPRSRWSSVATATAASSSQPDPPPPPGIEPPPPPIITPPEEPEIARSQHTPAPGNLRIEEVTAATVKLRWDVPQGVAYSDFSVSRATTSGGPFTTIQEYRRGVSTHYWDRDVAGSRVNPETTYYYRVSFAYNLHDGIDANAVYRNSTVSATTLEANSVVAPTNFRVLNGTLVSGVWEVTGQRVELDWNLPQGSGKGLGNKLTRLWSDAASGACRNDNCPRLVLYHERSTGNTGYTDVYVPGGTYEYRIHALSENENVGPHRQITVRVPDPVFTPIAPSGLTARGRVYRGNPWIDASWVKDWDAPAYLIQWRATNGSYDTSATGASSKINKWKHGPNRYGADGYGAEHGFTNNGQPLFFMPAKGAYVHTTGIQYSTTYYMRVGTCETVDCTIADVVFASERSVYVPADPN